MGQRKLRFRVDNDQEKTRPASGARAILKRQISRHEIARFEGLSEGMGKRTCPLTHPVLGPYRTKLMQNEGLSEEEQYSVAKEIERMVERGKRFGLYGAGFQLCASYAALIALIVVQPGWAAASGIMLATLVALSKISGIPNRRYIDPGIDAAIELMGMEKIKSPQASGILTRIALDEEMPVSWLSKEKSGTVARFLSDGISGLDGGDRKKAMDLICQHGSEKDQQAALMKDGLDKAEKERLAHWLSLRDKYKSSDSRPQDGMEEKPGKPEQHGWCKTTGNFAWNLASDLNRSVHRTIKSGIRLGMEAFVELPVVILAAIADKIVYLIARRHMEEGRLKEIEAAGKKRIALTKTNEIMELDKRKGDPIAPENADRIDGDPESIPAGQTIGCEGGIERKPLLKP